MRGATGWAAPAASTGNTVAMLLGMGARGGQGVLRELLPGAQTGQRPPWTGLEDREGEPSTWGTFQCHGNLTSEKMPAFHSTAVRCVAGIDQHIKCPSGSERTEKIVRSLTNCLCQLHANSVLDRLGERKSYLILSIFKYHHYNLYGAGNGTQSCGPSPISFWRGGRWYWELNQGVLYH